MKDLKQTYNEEQIYNQGKDPLRTQGRVSLLNRIVRTTLAQGKDFLNNEDLARQLKSVATAQDVPPRLCKMMTKIYKVYAECI